MTIMHDINVRVLGPRRQGELNEPLCPPPDVSGSFAESADSCCQVMHDLTCVIRSTSFYPI